MIPRNTRGTATFLECSTNGCFNSDETVARSRGSFRMLDETPVSFPPYLEKVVKSRGKPRGERGHGVILDAEEELPVARLL